MYQGTVGSARSERVQWYESQAVTQGVLVAGILAFVSALLLLDGGVARRRLLDEAAPSGHERFARRILGAASLPWLFAVAFVTHLLVSLFLDTNVSVTPPPFVSRSGRILQYVSLAGAAGAVVATGFAWCEGYWTRSVRLHYSVVTVLALLFARRLHLLRILPM